MSIESIQGNLKNFSKQANKQAEQIGKNIVGAKSFAKEHLKTFMKNHENVDTFIKQHKPSKETAIGYGAIIATLLLAAGTIKGIINKIKDIKNK